ncbi:hypothetical protein AAFC00_001260 [Neodothiora populina]|uniref:Uncharacterized protein n=1 Tax=Neodothiora populina TaxID=2781224 RepID=A0ABR3PNB4_9PEZI
MGFMEQLRAKYEIYRLEQRYTRRDKRKTYTTGATYVDGEYVYGDSPTTSTTTTNSSATWGESMNGRLGASKRNAGVKVKDIMSSSKGTRI